MVGVDTCGNRSQRQSGGASGDRAAAQRRGAVEELNGACRVQAGDRGGQRLGCRCDSRDGGRSHGQNRGGRDNHRGSGDGDGVHLEVGHAGRGRRTLDCPHLVVIRAGNGRSGHGRRTGRCPGAVVAAVDAGRQTRRTSCCRVRDPVAGVTSWLVRVQWRGDQDRVGRTGHRGARARHRIHCASRRAHTVTVQALLLLAGEGLGGRRVDGGHQHCCGQAHHEHRDLRDGLSSQTINSQGSSMDPASCSCSCSRAEPLSTTVCQPACPDREISTSPQRHK